MQRVALAAVLTLLLTTALPAATRKWTSKDGKFSTVAELVDWDDAQATLKKKTGETIQVPLDALCDADRAFLRKQKKPSGAPGAAGGAAPAAAEKPENVIAYTSGVQPFLAQYCAECHNANKAKDGYDVTSYAALTRPGKNGALVLPGKPAESRLMEVMRGMSKSMPPNKSPQPPPEEITKIGAWIAAGAQDNSAAAAAPPTAGKGKGPVTRKPPRKTT